MDMIGIRRRWENPSSFLIHIKYKERKSGRERRGKVI